MEENGLLKQFRPVWICRPTLIRRTSCCVLKKQGSVCGDNQWGIFFFFWTWVIQVLFCRHCTNDFNDFYKHVYCFFLSFQISLRPRNFFFSISLDWSGQKTPRKCSCFFFRTMYTGHISDVVHVRRDACMTLYMYHILDVGRNASLLYLDRWGCMGDVVHVRRSTCVT